MKLLPLFPLLFSIATFAENTPDLNPLFEAIQLTPHIEEKAKFYNPGKCHIFPETSETERKWKTYADDYLTFKYPDHADISFAVTPGEKFDETVECLRTYHLTYKGANYARIDLFGDTRFDDSICECGSIQFEKYLFHHDDLFRVSFLHSGQIKKGQVLNHGLRAYLYQWTHSLAPQSIFREILLSIDLKKPAIDRSKAQAEIVDTYGFEGALGFMGKGMTKAEVIKLLGKPAEETPDTLIYKSPIQERYQSITTITFEEGIFNGFTPGFSQQSL